MIPLVIVMRLRTRRQRQFGLWLPLFLVWLLLLPLVLVLLPFFVIGCLIARMNPWRVFVTGWQIIAGLRGTHIEFEHGRQAVMLHIV